MKHRFAAIDGVLEVHVRKPYIFGHPTGAYLDVSIDTTRSAQAIDGLNRVGGQDFAVIRDNRDDFEHVASFRAKQDAMPLVYAGIFFGGLAVYLTILASAIWLVGVLWKGVQRAPKT